MSDPWENALSDNFIPLVIDGETVKYNAQTGEVLFISSYQKGEAVTKAQVYQTGRGVVKVRVDGASHRLMDVIYENFHGVRLKGFQGYPKNGDFSDLRIDNIIMVRTREKLFDQESPE